MSGLRAPPVQRVLNALAPWEAPDARVQVDVVVGESRGGGHAEGTGICYPLIVGPKSARRVWMLSNVRAPGLPFEADFVARDAMGLTPLNDCRFGNRAEGWAGGQSDPIGQHLTSFSYALDAADFAAGTPRRRIFIGAGVGGRRSEQIIRGAPAWAGRFGTFVIYDRVLRAIQRAVDLAALYWGQQCEVRFMPILQGLNDINAPGGQTPVSVWRDRIEQHLIAAYDQDIPLITGQTTPITYLLEQSPSDLRGRPANAALAQAEMADRNLNGRTHLACVSYGLPLNARDDNADAGTLHHTARGVIWQGEVFARAARAIAAGAPLPRCKITQVARTGQRLRLTANRPLVADYSHFGDPGRLGFAARDGAGAIMPAGISAASVVGRTVTLTLAAGVASVEYAHERAAGALSSGDASTAWYDGEVDTAGIPARTPGAWGVLRAEDRAEPSIWAPGAVIKDWLETGRWTVPPA